MKNIIRFNGKLYAPLEEGGYTISGQVVDVVLKLTAPPEPPKCGHDNDVTCSDCRPAPKQKTAEEKLTLAVEALKDCVQALNMMRSVPVITDFEWGNPVEYSEYQAMKRIVNGTCEIVDKAKKKAQDLTNELRGGV